jgi:hypothetical protein
MDGNEQRETNAIDNPNPNDNDNGRRELIRILLAIDIFTDILHFCNFNL